MPRIQLAFCWCFPDESPRRGLQRLAAFGFDGIELWPQYLRAFGATAWADALRGAGMECAQLCPYFDFVNGPEQLTDSRRQLEVFLAAARITACHKLRVFTGPPWGPGVVYADDATPQQWDTAIHHLREFCARAAATARTSAACAPGC
jgi:sugar phosphate isomerase/epimerase